MVGCMGGELIILKGDGTGNFSVLNTYNSGSSLMASIELADFNNDGILDIAVPGGLVTALFFYPGWEEEILLHQYLYLAMKDLFI